MTIDFTSLINAIIGLLAVIISTRLIPWLKAKLTAEQYASTQALIKVAVYAAEEIYRSGNGDQKLEYVQNYLAGKGVAVDIEEIKAAVNEMRNATSIE